MLSRIRRPVTRQWHWYTISIPLFISTLVFDDAHLPCIAPSPEFDSRHSLNGFACIWLHLRSNTEFYIARLEPLSYSFIALPSSDHWHSLKQLPAYINLLNLPPPYPPQPKIAFTPPRKHHFHTRHTYTYTLEKWAWIRTGLSTIASLVTVKRLAGPTALKPAAWATSKRRLVPHPKLPLPPALVNPPSGHHQWVQANPASIYNRQSTSASTAQTTHSPHRTPADPRPSTGPRTSPPPSRPRPLQFLSLFLSPPLPPPSKSWRLLRHSPLSLRCRARRRRHLETAVSQLKRRPSSGTTPTHSIFYGFGREGWILHNHLGWLSDSALQNSAAGWNNFS